MALITSAPRRMPLSKRTVVRSPTASTTRRQGIDRRDGPVELAAAVVGDDDTRHALVHGPPRVVGGQDAFQEDGQPGVLTQVGQVVPGARRVRIDRADILDGTLRLLPGIGAEHVTEDGVAEIVRQPLAEEEGQVGILKVTLAPGEQAGVEGHDDGTIAGLLCPAQEARHQLVAPGPVELEPAGDVPHLGGHLFDRPGRHGA